MKQLARRQQSITPSEPLSLGPPVPLRTDALERRRELMEAWARFLYGATANNVVPMVRVAGA